MKMKSRMQLCTVLVASGIVKNALPGVRAFPGTVLVRFHGTRKDFPLNIEVAINDLRLYIRDLKDAVRGIDKRYKNLRAINTVDGAGKRSGTQLQRQDVCTILVVSGIVSQAYAASHGLSHAPYVWVRRHGHRHDEKLLIDDALSRIRSYILAEKARIRGLESLYTKFRQEYKAADQNGAYTGEGEVVSGKRRSVIAPVRGS